MDANPLEKKWNDLYATAALEQGLILNPEDQARRMLARRPAAVAMPDILDFIHGGGLHAADPKAVNIPGATE